MKDFLQDLRLFLAVRKRERKGVAAYITKDGAGSLYAAFDFEWRGKTYVCDNLLRERYGILPAILYEMNRQHQIVAMTDEDWAEVGGKA